MTEMRAGRLEPGDGAPREGEEHIEVAAATGFRVEQILSGHVSTPVEFIQAHDEWVVVVEGSATMEVLGRRVELTAGDWALLPSGVPHVLVKVEPGTSWLAVHGDPMAI